MEHAYRENLDYYEERAAGLLASATDGTPAAAAAFDGAPLTLQSARAVIARRHGLPDWPALARHVQHLQDDPFARAYRAIEGHDLDHLGRLLTAHPDLTSAKGTNGNDLLGLASATHDERLVRLLLEHGADVAAANVHGWTALHQAAYSNLPRMAELLLQAGAPQDAEGRGAGGTPVVVALFWGHREVTALLAPTPHNLRVTAGLGLTEAIATAPAGPRGFYRPHSGFPHWQPADDEQEALDEAVAWAARNDRPEAIDALHARGARLDRDVYRGTPLAWAAATGSHAAVRHLIGHGVDPSGRSSFGGPDHGRDVTPLHLAAQNGDRATAALLLDLGADPSLKDALYDATPEDWARHAGHPGL